MAGADAVDGDAGDGLQRGDPDHGAVDAAAPAFDNCQFADTVLHYYRYRWGGSAGTEVHSERQRAVEAMPDIVVPTTHIQGFADHCTRPETATRFESRVSARYERIDLPCVGHFPQREVPDEVAAVMREWIRHTTR